MPAAGVERDNIQRLKFISAAVKNGLLLYPPDKFRKDFRLIQLLNERVGRYLIISQLGVALPIEDIPTELNSESPLFQDSVKRMLQHLKANEAGGNGRAEVVLGNQILMDPEMETVIDNSSAADRMSREYRKDFEVFEVS